MFVVDVTSTVLPTVCQMNVTNDQIEAVLSVIAHPVLVNAME